MPIKHNTGKGTITGTGLFYGLVPIYFAYLVLVINYWHALVLAFFDSDSVRACHGLSCRAWRWLPDMMDSMRYILLII
jgi:hypothetical protein